MAVGDDDVGVLHIIYIYIGDFPSSTVGLVEVRQLCVEDGGLDFVEAAVAAHVVEDVVARRAVVAQGAHHVGQFVVVGGHGSGISKGPEVLRGVEAVAGSMAEAAAFLAKLRILKCAAMCLGVVLKEQEAVLLAEVTDAGGVGAAAIEVDNHDGTGLFRDGLLYQAVVYLERIDAGLHKHGHETVLGDGEDGGDVGVCWHDDLVAVLQPPQFLVGTEDERQRVEAVGTAHAVLRPDILGIVLLKSACGLPPQIPAAAQHLVGCVLVWFIDGFQVQVLHGSIFHS